MNTILPIEMYFSGNRTAKKHPCNSRGFVYCVQAWEVVHKKIVPDPEKLLVNCTKYAIIKNNTGAFFRWQRHTARQEPPNLLGKGAGRAIHHFWRRRPTRRERMCRRSFSSRLSHERRFWLREAGATFTPVLTAVGTSDCSG